MNSLKVPESGLSLQGSSGNDSNLPPQAFPITLNDNVIEDMIKCVQGGGDIELALGSIPTFLYSHKAYRVPRPAESDPCDVYLTRPFESTREAQRLPYAGSLFEKPKMTVPSITVHTERSDKEIEVKPKSSKPSKESSPSRLDSGLESLRSGLQAAEAGREKAVMIGTLPSKKTASKKGKLLPGYSSTPRSIPASPAVRSIASPSSPAISASQQTLERAKEQRVTLVHELAVQERSLEYLRKKWTGKEEDLRPTLEKVADHLSDTKKWAMKKAHWKELDVWNYDYDTQELRQKAIDNAIRHYDKQRLSASEPEWQKLLPKEERGQGKCLSRLQANLAKGPAPSTTKNKKSDSGGSVKDDNSSVDGDKPRIGGQSMSRAGSNPLPTKAKKVSGGDAQVKRLLGNSKAKTAAPKTTTPKQTAPKTSPVKAKATGTKANGGRILSKEIIENSDSSDDEALAVKPKPVVKAKETVVAKSRPTVKQPVKQPVKQQPAKQPPVKQQQQPLKRPREDDDSSSSSGTPLSKRLKPRQTLPTSSSRLKHRPSDASQNSRGTATSSSLKSKNTSPAKSSPLASSPPTNASDFENDTAPAPVVSKKRKAEDTHKPVTSKRPAVTLSAATVTKAHRFKVYYEKYEALHWEIAKLENPPDQKLFDLKEMRSRLATMKQEIYEECGPDRSKR